MSGVLRAIGKVFKKVVKVVKKVALPALAIGAVVLTGGAAIGALPSLGTMIGGLGLSSGVTSALTAAVSTAAKGAIIGGVTSAISGGNILEGAGMGAGLGFVGGGLFGAGGLLNSAGGAATGTAAAEGATTLAAPVGEVGTVALPASIPAGGVGLPAGGVAAAAPAGATVAAAAPAAAAPAGGGLLSSLTNPMVLGPTISGIGQGLGNYAASKDQRKLAEAERERIAANYGGGLGLLDSGFVSEDRNRPKPTQRFDPRTYGGTYQFDPAIGRVVFVPNQAG